MAGSGYHDFVAGATLTAAQLDLFLMEQSTMVFDDAATRDTALASVKSEAMRAFLLDSNTLTVYSGSAWSTVGIEHGVLPTWTPTVTQSGSVTVTNTKSTYQRKGREITYRFQLTVTGSGTGANTIVIGGFGTAAASHPTAVGSGVLTDNSSGFRFPFIAELASTTTITLSATNAPATTADLRLGVTGIFTAALAANDTLAGTFTIEASADA